jgi:hypothetical protein
MKRTQIGATSRAMRRVIDDPSIGTTRQASGTPRVPRDAPSRSPPPPREVGRQRVPGRLSGEAIPLPARLMALADVFDALICRRVYKEPFPMDEVDGIIVAGRGKHFDPAVVDAFEVRIAEFIAVARRYADSEADVRAQIDRIRGQVARADGV